MDWKASDNTSIEMTVGEYLKKLQIPDMQENLNMFLIKSELCLYLIHCQKLNTMTNSSRC